MRQRWRTSPAILAGVGVLLLGGSLWAEEKAACGNHGTSVQFVDTPAEAAKQAVKEKKLVFVLHVSGHFEDPKLT